MQAAGTISSTKYNTWYKASSVPCIYAAPGLPTGAAPWPPSNKNKAALANKNKAVVVAVVQP